MVSTEMLGQSLRCFLSPYCIDMKTRDQRGYARCLRPHRRGEIGLKAESVLGALLSAAAERQLGRSQNRL